MSGFSGNVYAAPFDALADTGMQINGSMDVSQERGSTAFALTPGTASYIQDGWIGKFNRAATLAINGNPAVTGNVPTGFQNCFALSAGTGLASLATGDYIYAATPIEGYRTARLLFGTANAQSVTVGFWVFASIAGTMTVSLQNAAANRTYPINVTINNASTWEYKTVTFPGDTAVTWLNTNGIGLWVIFCAGSGATNQGTANSWNANGAFATSATTNFMATTSNLFNITGVVVLPGIGAPTSARSQFIMRPFDQELLACQRYYMILPMNVQAGAAGQFIAPWPFFNPMRATPTALNTATGTLSATTINTEFGDAGPTGGYFQFTTTSAGGFIINRRTNFDARL